MTSWRSAVRVSHIPMVKDYTALKQLAVLLFAASLREICPKVVFLRVEPTLLGFAVDFLLPFPLTDDYKDLLEKSVREKTRRGHSFDIWEMVSKNAKEYLLHTKQPFLAESIDVTEQFTEIFRFGDFAAPMRSEIERNLAEVGAWSISVAKEGKSVYWHKKSYPIQTLRGFVFPDKKQLKNFQRQLKEAEKFDHRTFLQRQGWLSVQGEELCWLPDGVKNYRRMVEIWKSQLLKSGSQEILTYGTLDLEKAATGNGVFHEVLVEEEEAAGEEFGLKTFCRSEVGHVSIRGKVYKKTLLQTIEDFSRIFSLAIAASDKKVWVAEDIYGISWPVIEIEVSGAVETAKFYFNRIFALVIEQNKCWPGVQ